MAYYDTTWYCNAGDQATTGYYAIAKRASGAAVVAGQLVRQFTAPAVGSERVFICIIAGTTAVATDATWVLTRGAKTVDGTATWMEVTGMSAVNGDLTNTVNWTQAKAIGTPTLGAIIQRNSGASYWICTTAGTMGASEPAWPSNTAGATQADGTTTWTCLGVVGNFTGGQAPHARLANVCTTNWFAAGNTVYVGDNHAESQATAITISSVAVATSATGKILCHNHSSSYPPASSDLTTGASLATTSNVAINFTPNSAFYIYGLTFKSGVGQSVGASSITVGSVGSSSQNWQYFDNCSFWLSNTNGGNLNVGGGSTPGFVIFNNSTVKFANAISAMLLNVGSFIWQNTGLVLASGSVIPTSGLIVAVNATFNGSAIIEGVDLSQITGSLIGTSSSGYQYGNILIKDCKLNAAATVSSPSNSGAFNQLVRCGN